MMGILKPTGNLILYDNLIDSWIRWKSYEVQWGLKGNTRQLLYFIGQQYNAVKRHQ